VDQKHEPELFSACRERAEGLCVINELLLKNCRRSSGGDPANISFSWLI
jgi:hypothetical protein